VAETRDIVRTAWSEGEGGRRKDSATTTRTSELISAVFLRSGRRVVVRTKDPRWLIWLVYIRRNGWLVPYLVVNDTDIPSEFNSSGMLNLCIPSQQKTLTPPLVQ
jgi:hypothetical protein